MRELFHQKFIFNETMKVLDKPHKIVVKTGITKQKPTKYPPLQKLRRLFRGTILVLTTAILIHE